MIDYPGLIEGLVQSSDSKIFLLVMDGVGGLPPRGQRKTELEAARTPNLDELAKDSSCGQLLPVSWGVTPGSGPGHFALFGYDPVEFNVGRGVLEAAGIDFPLSEQDVAARGNFVTVDSQGLLTDRRAGRISTEENARICQKLRHSVSLPDLEVHIEPVQEHRLLVVFRGANLEGDIEDTDPQKTGVAPLTPIARNEGSQKTAELAASFLSQCATILADEPQANLLTLRGFARHRFFPSLHQRFGLKALCTANYPMYRGVSRLLGMDLYPVVADLASQVSAVKESLADYTFFFLHAKSTDKTGEDGNFQAKVAAIEEIDSLLPEIRLLSPDVLAITGDHSTPSTLRSHSWHPVPVLLHSANCRFDRAQRLTEEECCQGALGQLPAKHLMPLMLAHAGRLGKFGA